MDYETVLEELLEEFHKAISALDGVIAKAKELPKIDEPILVYSTTDLDRIKSLEDQVIVRNATLNISKRNLLNLLTKTRINDRFTRHSEAGITTA